MGGCGSKPEQVTPQSKNMLYSNDPVINIVEKELKLSEQRFEILQHKYTLSRMIAENPQNSFELTSDLKSKLQYLEQNSSESQKVLTHTQAIVQTLKDTTDAGNFGKQVDVIKQNQKKLEEFLNFFDQGITGIKEAWLKHLIREGEKQNLTTKLPQYNAKLQASLSKLQHVIDTNKEHISFCRERLDILTANGEFTGYQGLIDLLKATIERHNARLDEGQEAHNKTSHSHQDFQNLIDAPVTVKTTIDTISDLANNISNARELVQGYLTQINGDRLHREQLLSLCGDLSLSTSVQRHSKEHQAILQHLQLKKYDESFNSFKKAIEMLQLQTQEEEVIEELKETAQEVNEIIGSLSQIREESLLLEKEIEGLVQETPNFDKHSISSEQINDFITKLRESRDKQIKLIDDAYALHREVEIKKVSINNSNVQIKLDFVSEYIDSLKEQFQTQSEASDALYNIIDNLKQTLDQSPISFTQVMAQSLKNLIDQIDEFQLEAMQENFSKIELSFNEIMNFWSEKEKSGEFINNPDDANHLITELGSIEDQIFDQELRVNQLTIANSVVEQALQKIFKRPSTLIQSQIDSYAQARKIVNTLIKNHDNAKQLPKHTELKEQIANFSRSLENHTDVYGEEFRQNVQVLNNAYSTYYAKFATIRGALADFNEHADHNLVWSADSKIIYIEDFKEGNNIITSGNYDFKVTDPNSDIQKKIKENEQHEIKQRILPLTIVGQEPTYQFGQSYKTTLQVLQDVLCVSFNGGLIPFDEFVKSQYLEILKKDLKPNVEIKEAVVTLSTLVHSYSQ